MNEEDIFPTFDSFGPLKDVSIIRDKHTQLHRGCAFVTYWSSEDAEKAQEALHGKHTFPGARRPAQVKPAEPSVPENKLFVGMLSRKAGEEEVRELFAPFGEIREIYMIRNADGSSKCAAFLRYVQRESAEQAIASLHSNLVMDGAARPLIVKFADNKQQRHQRHIRNVRRQEMMAAMGPGGFPGYPVPPHMAMGPHGGPPHYMGPPQFGYGGPAAGGAHPHAYSMYPQYAHPQYGYQGRQETDNRNANNPRPREGPAGANLFVYHLPHDLTDADLATAFNPFGNVISAKVYVDRYTGESKGFGFVSYDSVISAESAIEQMNGFQIGNKRLKVQHKRVHGNQQHQGPPHPAYPHPHYDPQQAVFHPAAASQVSLQTPPEEPSAAGEGPPTTQSE
jgi:CUG-BP- and ETR3-like factor